MVGRARDLCSLFSSVFLCVLCGKRFFQDNMTNITTISVLSAGSIEPGLVAAVDSYNAQGAAQAQITWATTPAIRGRIASGEVFDVVIASDAAVDEFSQQQKVARDRRVSVGRVGVGVVARADVDVPDISGVDALKRAVLNAESVVFNRASSGLYVETLMKKLGLHEQIQEKSKRFDNGPAMMAHLINGKGREIAFGAIIEILMFRDQGLMLTGPLPPEVQHWTAYVAVPMVAAPNAAGAQSFLHYLATVPVIALFAAHGIE
jgi:molybdate transport system substrate-binding protein